MILSRLDPQLQLDPSLHLRRPGEVLLHDYMQPAGLTPRQLAKRCGIPSDYLKGVIEGRRRLHTSEAMRLAIVFHTGELYWLLLQAYDDLRHVRERRAKLMAKDSLPEK